MADHNLAIEDLTIERLTEIKTEFYASRFLSVKSFFRFNYTMLEWEAFADWDESKQSYLAKEHVAMEGMANVFRADLMARIEGITILQDRAFDKLKDPDLSVKDLKELGQIYKNTSAILDETSKIMKLNTFQAKEYEKNKDFLNNKLYNIVEI